jgi:hypothetical protein
MIMLPPYDVVVTAKGRVVESEGVRSGSEDVW